MLLKVNAKVKERKEKYLVSRLQILKVRVSQNPTKLEKFRLF